MEAWYGLQIDWSWSSQASPSVVLCMTRPVNIIQQKLHLSLSTSTVAQNHTQKIKCSWKLEHRTKVRLSILITVVPFALYYSSVSMGGDYTIVVFLFVYLFSLRDFPIPQLQVNLDALLRCSYSACNIKTHLITSNCPYCQKKASETGGEWEREGEWILVSRG